MIINSHEKWKNPFKNDLQKADNSEIPWGEIK